MESLFCRQLQTLQWPLQFSKGLVRGLKSDAKSAVKPFHAIPGPKPLPLVGNIWRYLPLIGEFDLSRFDKNAEVLMKRHGTLVKETIVLGNTVLHVFDPNDMETVFRLEGEYPQRKSHRALMKYRMDRKTTYSSGGLFPTVGEEWSRLRKPFQKSMLNLEMMKNVVSGIDAITEDLIKRIRTTRNSENEVEDFLKDLFKWALEGTGLFILNTRLGCLSPIPSQDVDDLITSANCTNEAVMTTESSSGLWKWFPTKAYRQLATSQDTMARIVRKYLDLALSKHSEEDSLLNRSLHVPGLDEKDVFTVFMDFFLAGIDTTSIASGFLLYNMARNPGVQDRLREEVFRFLPEKTSPVNQEMLNKMSYLRACVKENMRLAPVSVGVGRVLHRDIVLQGYHVPAGTKIVTHNQVACRQPENFTDPLTFRPERWIRDSPQYEKRHPFLVLPFGFGPRSCIGQRFAEGELYVLLAKVIRNFRVDYKYEDIGFVTRLVNTPDKPLKFCFTDVEK